MQVDIITVDSFAAAETLRPATNRQSTRILESSLSLVYRQGLMRNGCPIIMLLITHEPCAHLHVGVFYG